jgi:hypothetical protein
MGEDTEIMRGEMKMAYEFLDVEKELERIIPAIAELAAKEFYSQSIVFEGTEDLIALRKEFYWLLSSQRIPRTYVWENKCHAAYLMGVSKMTKDQIKSRLAKLHEELGVAIDNLPWME